MANDPQTNPTPTGPQTVQDYLDLITSQYANQPDFLAVVSLAVAPACQVQAVLASMIPLFDLDTPPVGDQLDIIGQWVGVSRNIDIPITGVFFTWDSTAALGWDSGQWAQPGQTNITVLPDAAYLNLVLGTIAANNWDGTTNGAYAVWDQLFPDLTVVIQDYENMSYAMGIIGVIDALTQALISGGYIKLRPEGIEITDYYFSTVPMFAWDLDTPLLQGWGSGQWATQVSS
jgi:hypothetical protein